MQTVAIRLHALMKANKRTSKMRERPQGVSSKFVQPKLVTINKAMQSLEDVVTFIKNKG